MLVVISDLHLKDGTSGSSITPDAFRVFAARLRSMAFQASWRADGSYKPIKSIDLLLLGDVFDMLRSELWLVSTSGEEETLRPWDDRYDPAYVQKVSEITSAILEYNREGLDTLRQINQGQEIYIPPATQNGEPDRSSSERVHIKVRIHYMVGNHDWFFYLPGEAYDRIRERVIAAMGLSNTKGPFPYNPEDSPQISELLQRYHVFGRHGDQFDPINYNAESGRGSASVGDAMTIDLLTRFPYEVRQKLGSDIPLTFSEGLKELSNVRPALVTPMWVNNLINHHAEDPEKADIIKRIWDDAAARFIQLPFVRANDKYLVFDSVDALEAALLFAKGLSFKTIQRLAGWVNQKLRSGNRISIAEFALNEPAFKKRTSQFIVYGHTHFHEIVPLDSYIYQGQSTNQIFINSGTWHSYHDMTLQAPSKLKFVGMHVMTYLAFFTGDERRGRRFEAWSGSLSQ
jgi:UDP-2,3-diacylglucosamine pyrophosphatase LpxH